MMKRGTCMGVLVAASTVAAAAAAGETAFPNKPGKKPQPRLIVGAQSGATTAPPEEIIVGAGLRNGGEGSGDYGLITPTPLKPASPKPTVGYDPYARLGNKPPSS